MNLKSLALSLDADKLSDRILEVLHALHIPQISLVLNVDAHIPPATLQALRGLNLASLELPGANLMSSLDCPQGSLALKDVQAGPATSKTGS